jgi:hypothetical protein
MVVLYVAKQTILKKYRFETLQQFLSEEKKIKNIFL